MTKSLNYNIGKEVPVSQHFSSISLFLFFSVIVINTAIVIYFTSLRLYTKCTGKDNIISQQS